MQSFSHSEMGSRSELGLAQSQPQWWAIGHAQAAHGHPRRYGWHLLSAGTTACLQGLFRHFQPNATQKNFAWEPAAEEAPDPPRALPSTWHQLWRRTCALFIGNRCPRAAPSGDQAQADAIAPGARFGAADPRVYACWRSGLVLPAALQLAGEREPGRAVEQHAWRWLRGRRRSTFLVRPKGVRAGQPQRRAGHAKCPSQLHGRL